MIDDRTPNLNLPLPNQANDLADDVGRLRSALGTLDTAVAGKANASALASKADASAVATALQGKADLVDGKVPAGQLPPQTPPIANTDALTEGTTNLYFTAARALAAVPVASASVLGKVKIGNGLTVDAEGVVSINGSSMAFTVVPLTITSNGQTTFTIAGGYTAGAIEVLLNGIELASDDYTASNGTTLVLAVGANTTDSLWVRRWRAFQVADAYTKAEADLMARPFSNPAALAQAHAIALYF